MTQNGIKLAVYIITNDFGKLVAQVCECLLRRGSLTRQGIARFAELPSEKVKKCLWILIQHNCVQAFALEQQGDLGKPPIVNTHYMALLGNIVQRIRFPKFLAIAKGELSQQVGPTNGQQCALLLEGLLQHGRLTLTQILDRATQEDENNADPKAVRERFFLLVKNRFVEHCPSPEPHMPLPPEGEQPTKKRGSKSSHTTIKEVALEEQALADAMPMEAERFSVDAVTTADTENETNRNGVFAIRSGEKRKLMEVESELDDVFPEKEPIWRVNFHEFNRLLRNKACIDTVRTRLDDNAAKVLSAMLKASGSSASTVSVTLDAIFEELLKSNQTMTMTLDHVRTILDDIGCDSDRVDMYSLGLSDIIKQAKIEEIESIVLKRYGREAYRIFRLLRSNSLYLDTDKISDRVFMDKKEATKILFKLWKDNFLHMEKVSRGAIKDKDAHPWKANDSNLYYKILDELYHVVLNFQIRSNYEKDQRRELLQISKEALTGENKTNLDRLRKRMMLLVNCILKLDDALLLFQD
ncbi:hypothetical protein Drorol1_Dr00013215 [Drosera rotundifolia]